MPLINILAGQAAVLLIAGNIPSRRQPGKIALPRRNRCSHATAGDRVVLEDVLPSYGDENDWPSNLGDTLYPHLGLSPTLCDNRPGDVEAGLIKMQLIRLALASSAHVGLFPVSVSL